MIVFCMVTCDHSSLLVNVLNVQSFGMCNKPCSIIITYARFVFAGSVLPMVGSHTDRATGPTTVPFTTTALAVGGGVDAEGT